MSQSSIDVRRATAGDLDRINEIYNAFVVSSTCTYQETPETPEARQAWFEQHGPEYPVTVAEIDRQIVGWGALSRFHPRSAYRFTVEDSVYVDQRWQRKGLGSLLLRDLVSRARLIGYRSILAIIDAEQERSIALHARFGFEPCGHIRQVGYKFGRWLDVVSLQKLL